MRLLLRRANHHVNHHIRHYSRQQPPKPAGPELVIRVRNNIAYLGPPKAGPKPRQLLSLPPFPSRPLPATCSMKRLNENDDVITAFSWVMYYFDGVPGHVVRQHFIDGLVQVECSDARESSSSQDQKKRSMRKINHCEVMKPGETVHIPVSIAESRISKRFDPIPAGTLYPNADEIKYLQRLVMYKDPAIIVLNKPPQLPLKGNLPVHNSMDALAAAALSFDYEEGPRLVHRFDRESSGILLMGRTKGSTSRLLELFSNPNVARTSCLEWNDACEATCMKYWALVIGSPKEKEGYVCAPLTKVLLNDGKTERVILAHSSGLEPSEEAVTEYRVLGPMINGCSWIELRPLTSRKHQLRVHCAEALGTPIVGDYKYGWCAHRKWQQTPQVNIEPTTGEPYKLRHPGRLEVQKGSVLSKVPLLHLLCRELVLPNVAKFLGVSSLDRTGYHSTSLSEKPDVLRLVATMPSHMKISWNVMSSYLV